MWDVSVRGIGFAPSCGANALEPMYVYFLSPSLSLRRHSDSIEHGEGTTDEFYRAADQSSGALLKALRHSRRTFRHTTSLRQLTRRFSGLGNSARTSCTVGVCACTLPPAQRGFRARDIPAIVFVQRSELASIDAICMAVLALFRTTRASPL